MFKKIVLRLLLVLLLLAAVAVGMNRFAPLTAAGLLLQASRAAAGLTVASVNVQGKEVPYLRGGNGETVVLVHGFTANKDTFNDLARYLTPHYTVLSLDLPGFGDASKDPLADYSYTAQMENVRAFVKAMGLGKVHLAGNSMGGGIVAVYAAKYPQEVASVWLLDAAATAEARQTDLFKTFDATGEFPLLVKTQAQQAKKFELLFGSPKFIPYCIEYAMSVAGERDYDLQLKILKTIRSSEPPIEVTYANLNTPALIVTGDKDQIIPPASAQTLAKVFTQAQVKVMSGIGHIPMVEAPRQTAQDYLAFRAQLGKAQ